MPNPYKIADDEPLAYGSRVIAERPACAIGVAIVCSAWTTVELHLAQLFQMATSKWTEHYPGTLQSAPNWVAIAALDSIDTVHAKCQMIERVCLASAPDDVRDRLKLLLSEVRKAAKARNLVAHARWAITDRLPQDVLLAENKKLVTFIKYQPDDFDGIVHRLDDLAMRLQMFGLSSVELAA